MADGSDSSCMALRPHQPGVVSEIQNAYGDCRRNQKTYGCVSLFVGKGAVEKAASWKSRTAGLFRFAWKSRNSGGISHFFHRPDYGGFTGSIFGGHKNS